MCWPGNCLARSIGLLSNNLPLLHLCFSFNTTSILYSFNCRLLICFPVNKSEVQTRRRNNSFRTVLLSSCDILGWHFGVMRCFTSCWVWSALRVLGDQRVKVGWSGHWWWPIPWQFGWDAAFQCVYPCLSLEVGKVAAGEGDVLNNWLGVGDAEIPYGRKYDLNPSLPRQYFDPSFYKPIRQPSGVFWCHSWCLKNVKWPCVPVEVT